MIGQKLLHISSQLAQIEQSFLCDGFLNHDFLLKRSEMESVAVLASGKCRRRYSPEHPLFAAGNALRALKYCRDGGCAAAFVAMSLLQQS